MTTLREKALAALYARYEQFQVRAEQLRALHAALAAEPRAPDDARFEEIARQTGAWDYQDYDDRFFPCPFLFDWINSEDAEDEVDQAL